MQTIGEAVISCCGVGLSVLEAEAVDEPHALQIARVEDESYISIEHEMTKEHYISFIAYATPDRFQMVKLYPEGVAACRFKLRGKRRFILLLQQTWLDETKSVTDFKEISTMMN